MPVSPLMLRFAEDELSRSPALVERTLAATLARLQQPTKPGTASSADRQSQQEAAESLRKGAQRFALTFADSLRAFVMADLQGLEVPLTAGPSSVIGGLQLMDETRVEADIEVARAAQLIDSAAEWELRELQTFTSTLIGQTHVSAESNPLRPSAYAQALWDACCAINAVPPQRGVLLRATATSMAAQLKMAWAGASTRLEAQGVTPSIYRTMVLPSSAPSAGTPPSPGAPKGFEQALQQIGTLLQVGATPGSRAATSTGSPPANGSGHGPTAAVASSGPGGVDRQAVELLSRIFEAVLSDHQLSPALCAVMARLQASVLRVAMVDRTLLASHQHPVWLMMNRIALAAEVWPQDGDPRMARLLAFCASLVQEIASASQPTASLYTDGLVRLEAQLSQELKQQQSQAQPTIDALVTAERRDALEREVSQQLVDQVRGIRTSPRLRDFLTQVWARVVTESMLRYGGGDERTAGMLRTVDDVLWSLRLPDHPQSRQRLLTLLPDLLKRLREGMALVALPEAEQQAVLDELMSIHTDALRSGARPEAREPTPQEIFQRLRDERPPEPAPGPAQGFADSLIDVFSMDTVPAELMPDGAGSESGAARSVDAMTPGSSCRCFLSGRWRRIQLLWRSASVLYFVFASETEGRVHSITRQALARLAAEGLVKPLSDTPMVQRAVDRVMRDLAAPA